MKNELVIAAGAIPVTLFLMANIGANTATMTGSDKDAIKTALGVTAGAMMIASVATGNVPATIATALAVGACFMLTRNIWTIPSVTDVVG